MATKVRPATLSCAGQVLCLVACAVLSCLFLSCVMLCSFLSSSLVMFSSSVRARLGSGLGLGLGSGLGLGLGLSCQYSLLTYKGLQKGIVDLSKGKDCSFSFPLLKRFCHFCPGGNEERENIKAGTERKGACVCGRMCGCCVGCVGCGQCAEVRVR